MAKKRKLFIGHASELAHRLVRSVRPNALIEQFAKSYAKRYKRHGVVDDMARIRELEQTLGREAILVMLAEIHRILPTSLGRGKNGFVDAEQAKFARMFQDEFDSALVRALDWSAADAPAEREAFTRDLGMYERSDESAHPLSDPSHNQESPFYDRCALLLDPSMMDAARSAAAQFEKQLDGTAAAMVDQIGSGGATRAKASGPRKKTANRAKTVPKKTIHRHESKKKKSKRRLPLSRKKRK